jgi:hypothetical protein
MLRALAVILSGFVSAVMGFIVVSIIFVASGLVINGREGYEAGGPIGFILGALIGFLVSGVRLFGSRTRV